MQSSAVYGLYGCMQSSAGLIELCVRARLPQRPRTHKRRLQSRYGRMGCAPSDQPACIPQATKNDAAPGSRACFPQATKNDAVAIAHLVDSTRLAISSRRVASCVDGRRASDVGEGARTAHYRAQPVGLPNRSRCSGRTAAAPFLWFLLTRLDRQFPALAGLLGRPAVSCVSKPRRDPVAY